MPVSPKARETRAASAGSSPRPAAASRAKDLLRPREGVLAQGLSRGIARREKATAAGMAKPATGAQRCRRKFLRIFPGGFRDKDYVALERAYKWAAHERWQAELAQPQFAALLAAGDYAGIAARAVRVESRTNLIFSFEKMALRDGVKNPAGAELFARGLYDFLHGAGEPAARFGSWVDALAQLPRRQTRVLTWPVATVFGFLAQPETHLFIKPTVMKIAAQSYGWDFQYTRRPTPTAYTDALRWAAQVKRDLRDQKPRDMIDVQSFLWVQGSEEY